MFTDSRLLDLYEGRCDGWQNLLAHHEREGEPLFPHMTQRFIEELEVERHRILLTGDLPARQMPGEFSFELNLGDEETSDGNLSASSSN